MVEYTLEELTRECLAAKRDFIKESTYLLYEAHLNNHIIPVLGNLKCSELTEENIQKAILYWANRGRKDHTGGLSDKTVKDITTLLKLFIRYGKKKGYVSQIDFDIVFPVRHPSDKIKTFSLEEQKDIIQAVKEEKDVKANGIMVCLYTGIRIGELCALKWSDIDFYRSTIFIFKTIQRLYYKGENGKGNTKITITTPKTAASVREIPLSDALICFLKDFCPKDKDTYLLTGKEKYIEPRTYRNYFNRFLEKYHITRLNFHSLRHTFATRCIENGGDYKTVSELLGHSSVHTTMNLYVHPGLEQKRKCVELVGNIL